MTGHSDQSAIQYFSNAAALQLVSVTLRDGEYHRAFDAITNRVLFDCVEFGVELFDSPCQSRRFHG